MLGKSGDLMSLIGNKQMKDDFMKDLTVQLANPPKHTRYEIPDPKFHLFRKVTLTEFLSQENSGKETKQQVLMLEELVNKPTWLTETL